MSWIRKLIKSIKKEYRIPIVNKTLRKKKMIMMMMSLKMIKIKKIV